MDTLLHTFKDLFPSCFAQICTSVKFIIIRIFACHTTQTSIPLFTTNGKIIILISNMRKTGMQLV